MMPLPSCQFRRIAFPLLLLIVGCGRAPSPPESTPPKSIAQGQKTPTSQPAPAAKAIDLKLQYSVAPLRELNLPQGTACAPTFSPDGSLIATGGEQNDSVAIWSWPDGELLHLIPISRARGMRGLCFSSDSRWLAFCTRRSFGVIRVATGEPVALHEDGNYSYKGLSWTSDDQFVCVIAKDVWDHEVQRLSPKTGKMEVVIPKFRAESVEFVASQQTPLLISPAPTDERERAEGEQIGLFALTDKIDRQQPQKKFRVPSSPTIPYRVAMSKDGTHFAFREGMAMQIDVFNVDSGEKVGGLQVPNDQMGSFQFLPGSHTKFIIDTMRQTWRYNSVSVRDITMPSQIRHVEVHAPTTISGVSISPDGQLVAIGFFNGQVAVWEVAAIEKSLAE